MKYPQIFDSLMVSLCRKLEKLERRTARAIGEVIRERLRAEEVG